MAVSNLVGKGAKKSVRIRKWLRITALLMAVWVVCAAAVAEGAALPEESASVQAEASDGQPAQAPPEGAPPEGERPPEPPGGEGGAGKPSSAGAGRSAPAGSGRPARRAGNGEPGHSRYYAGNGYHHQRWQLSVPKSG